MKKLFKKIADKTVGVRYNPVAYIGTQAVAGTNHAVLCETSMSAPGANDIYSIVVVYEDPDGNVKVTDVFMSEVRTYTAMPMGGWTTSEHAEITDGLKKVFEAATGSHLGIDLVPVALVSEQKASGTNYCFFCEKEKVTADPSKDYGFVYIYEDQDGNISVTDIIDFIEK